MGVEQEFESLPALETYQEAPESATTGLSFVVVNSVGTGITTEGSGVLVSITGGRGVKVGKVSFG